MRQDGGFKEAKKSWFLDGLGMLMFEWRGLGLVLLG